MSATVFLAMRMVSGLRHKGVREAAAAGRYSTRRPPRPQASDDGDRKKPGCPKGIPVEWSLPRGGFDLGNPARLSQAADHCVFNA
jgi:hypothetical protein